MSSEVRVLEDGVERESPRGATTQWVWLAIGLVIGLGLAVVFVAPLASPAPTTADASSAPEVPADPETPTSELGVAQVVEGFPDALVALTETQAGSLSYLLWPHSGPSVARPLPVTLSSEVELDASGTWIATATVVPGNEGLVLSVGKPSGMSPLTSGVGSFAWHDSEEGLLAYTAVGDGEWGLWTVGANRKPAPAPISGPEGGIVADWGDWGWAIVDPAAAAFTLFNSSGEVRTTREGVPYDSHSGGWLLVGAGQVEMVSSGGGVSVVSELPPELGAPMGGAISPDGAKVAIVGDAGLLLTDVDGAEAVLVEVTARFPSVGWSSDSRFAFVPTARGVMTIDTESEALQAILPHELVRAVGAIPLMSGS
jgi:hypothetical protein